jgi:hypothetical protein
VECYVAARVVNAGLWMEVPLPNDATAGFILDEVAWPSQFTVATVAIAVNVPSAISE